MILSTTIQFHYNFISNLLQIFVKTVVKPLVCLFERKEEEL